MSNHYAVHSKLIHYVIHNIILYVLCNWKIKNYFLRSDMTIQLHISFMLALGKVPQGAPESELLSQSHAGCVTLRWVRPPRKWIWGERQASWTIKPKRSGRRNPYEGIGARVTEERKASWKSGNRQRPIKCCSLKPLGIIRSVENVVLPPFQSSPVFDPGWSFAKWQELDFRYGQSFLVPSQITREGAGVKKECAKYECSQLAQERKV